METMCYHPWVGLDIDPQGKFSPCCKYQYKLSDNLDDYLASSELAQLRSDFINGKRPSGCVRCWKDESSGTPSKRQLDNKFILNNTPPDLTSIKILSLPFGNTCNLACRTCGSAASSRWSREEKKIKKHFPKLEIHTHQKFYKDKNYINKIKEISKNLVDVTIPGGEPFITGVDEQLDFLDFLLENNPKNISITYITNATTFPTEDFWKKWKNFKRINIQLSIDGIGERFEYLRWPAKWQDCYANIKQYQEMQKKCSNLTLSVSHTVSVFNVFYIQDFFIWCYKEKLPEPYIGFVNHPAHYSITSLPDDLKIKVKQRISTKKFASVLNYMESESKNNLNFQETIRWVKMIDQLRNQKIIDVFPEFKNYIE
jgi:sulfatase maturation enzyme AslB (radical SAM superfamily)